MKAIIELGNSSFVKTDFNSSFTIASPSALMSFISTTIADRFLFLMSSTIFLISALFPNSGSFMVLRTRIFLSAGPSSESSIVLLVSLSCRTSISVPLKQPTSLTPFIFNLCVDMTLKFGWLTPPFKYTASGSRRYSPDVALTHIGPRPPIDEVPPLIPAGD